MSRFFKVSLSNIQTGSSDASQIDRPAGANFLLLLPQGFSKVDRSNYPAWI
jgi:hypothetical protein